MAGDSLYCPITLALFQDPLLAEDGHTYERADIVEWIENNGGTSPLSRQPISVENLRTNRIVKQLADEKRNNDPRKQPAAIQQQQSEREATMINLEDPLDSWLNNNYTTSRNQQEYRTAQSARPRPVIAPFDIFADIRADIFAAAAIHHPKHRK
ncbi:unnamed protein product, partial [Didymodactylos carnosus]